MKIFDHLIDRAVPAIGCACLMGALCFTPAQAQQPGGSPGGSGFDQQAPLDLPPLPNQQPPGEKFGDWSKRCETSRDGKKQQCFISQTLVLKQNDQRRNVLFVAIGYYGPQQTPGAILRVPLGLGTFLPAGLQLSVPGTKPLRIVVESCLPTGCTAAVKLAPDMIAAMQKANRGTVELVTIRRQKLALPMSFKGFTAGFAALEKG